MGVMLPNWKEFQHAACHAHEGVTNRERGEARHGKTIIELLFAGRAGLFVPNGRGERLAPCPRRIAKHTEDLFAVPLVERLLPEIIRRLCRRRGERDKR